MTFEAGHLRVGPQSGRLLIRTGRQGLASKVGHDLTIEVTRWSADIVPGGHDVADTQIRASIELDSLEVREGTGGAMALTDRDRDEINGNIRRTLGRSSAVFTSTRVSPNGGGGSIEGTLDFNGVSRPCRLDVRNDGGHSYRATMTVVQSEHGIKPYTAFLGALKLRDDVAVEIEVDLAAAQR